jgi:sterol desaturase/sphingolipid hydroxylase (fatty acid hydroxylase superfamily)
MIERAIAGIASLAILIVIFVPLERMFPARREQRVLRPALIVDGCFFFGQYLVWNATSYALLSGAEALARARVPSIHVLPIWAQGILAVVAGDFLVYWFHRACHAWTPLWRFHAVHHTSEHLDFLAAHREHPVDGIGTAFAQNLPAFLLGFRVDAIAALIAFRAVWAIFVHSNVRLPLGPLRLLFGAPELHHWHHANVTLIRGCRGSAEGGTGDVTRTRHNFANLAPWLDVLFGTHFLPDHAPGEERFPLGIDEPAPRGYLAQLAWPVLATLRACGSWRSPTRTSSIASSSSPRAMSSSTPATCVAAAISRSSARRRASSERSLIA